MIEYFVNEEKRTIVAMIKFGENEETFKNSSYIYDDLSYALKRFKKEEYYTKKYNKEYNKMYFPKYMSAKAKCSPEDEWNEEYGKNLAYNRLVEKIHNYRSNSYKIIADVVEEIKDFVC